MIYISGRCNGKTTLLTIRNLKREYWYYLKRFKFIKAFKIRKIIMSILNGGKGNK